MTSFFAARDAACQMLAEHEGRPEREHSDPVGGYGYVPGSSFGRARDAKRRAEGDRDFSARFLADNLAKSEKVDEYDLRRYREDVAAHVYASAVYAVEAATVRGS